jgi:hypothetical protein
MPHRAVPAMAGPDPAIHALSVSRGGRLRFPLAVDGRVRPGHDGERAARP